MQNTTANEQNPDNMNSPKDIDMEDFVVVESSFPNPGNLNGINNFMETDDPLIHNDDNIICETMSCISLYCNLGMAVS